MKISGEAQDESWGGHASPCLPVTPGLVPDLSGDTGLVLRPFGVSQLNDLPYDLTDLEMTWLS